MIWTKNVSKNEIEEKEKVDFGFHLQVLNQMNIGDLSNIIHKRKR